MNDGAGSKQNPIQFNSKNDLAAPVLDPRDVNDFFSSTASAGVNRSDIYNIQSVAAHHRVMDAFNAWKSARDAETQQHAQYVEQLQQGSGRQATILTAPGAELSPTLLTPPGLSRKGKTVLG